MVQRVLGEEEEVGMIAECCDSRLHSLHRAVDVAVCGLGWSRVRAVSWGMRSGCIFWFTPG